jgi:hypothetical protein
MHNNKFSITRGKVKNVRVRKINLSELEYIAKLLVEQMPGREFDEAKEHTEWHLKGFSEFCLVAEDKNKIVGFIISHLHENALEIEELYAVRGHENVFGPLITEVLNKIPKVDNITMEIDTFHALIKQLK